MVSFIVLYNRIIDEIKFQVQVQVYRLPHAGNSVAVLYRVILLARDPASLGSPANNITTL